MIFLYPDKEQQFDFERIFDFQSAAAYCSPLVHRCLSKRFFLLLSNPATPAVPVHFYLFVVSTLDAGFEHKVMSISACAARLSRPLVRFAQSTFASRSKATTLIVAKRNQIVQSHRAAASRLVYIGLGINMAAAVQTFVLSDDEQSLIRKADELFDAANWTELEKLLDTPQLQQQSANRFEFEWRLARCWYQQIKEKQRDEKDIAKAKDLVLLALEHNPQSGPAHKVSMLDCSYLITKRLN